jgi:hypothetical protein
MKLRRLFQFPAALVADVFTLGNMGERPYTQQVIDKVKRDDEDELILKLLRITLGTKEK